MTESIRKKNKVLPRVLVFVVNSIAMLIMPWMTFGYIYTHKVTTLYFAICIAMGIINLLMIVFCEYKRTLTPAIHTALLCMDVTVIGFFAGVYLYVTNDCELVIAVYALSAVAGAVTGFVLMLIRKIKNSGKTTTDV